MQSIPANLLRQAYRQTSLTAMALAGAVLLYAVAVELLKRQRLETIGAIEPSDATVIRYVILGISVLCVLAARILKVRLLSRIVLDRGGVREDNLPALIRRLRTAHIIAFVCAETPAFLGFVYFLLVGESRIFYMLFVISLYLFVVHMPRYGQWERWIRSRVPGSSFNGSQI